MEIIKILVVDDEVDICEFARNFLRKKNYCTLGANNTTETLRQVGKERPHIVLLDVRLGADSGMALIPKIKKIDKNIKVIMLTALDDEESVKQAMALGADDYVPKPFNIRQLEGLILEKLATLGTGLEKK